MKKFSIFASALGASLANFEALKKLSIAFLPIGWGLEVAREIVESVNKSSSTKEGQPGHPYCVHVFTDQQQPEGIEITAGEGLKFTLNQALSYRQGSRLVIVSDDSATIASVDGTFQEVLNPSYPEGAVTEIGLRELAKNSLVAIFQELGLGATESVPTESAIRRLENCLIALEDCHRIMGASDSKDWNVSWQIHVSSGLENLFDCLAGEKQSPKAPQTIDQLLELYTYACFGLPRPTDGLKISSSGTPPAGKALADAIETYWESKERIEDSCAYLNRWPKWEGVGHPIGKLNLKHFESGHVGTGGNSLLGWISLARGEKSSFEPLSQLSEVEFMNPKPPSLSGKNLLITHAAGESIRISVGKLSTNLCWMDETGDGMVATPELTVTIPSADTVPIELLQSSQLRVISRDNRVDWVGALEVNEDGQLVSSGRLFWKPGSSQSDSLVRPITLSLELSSGDPLYGAVDRQSSADLYLMPSSPSGIAVWKLSKTSKVKGLDQLGPSAETGAESGQSSIDLPESGLRVAVICWGETPTIEDKAVPPLAGIPGGFLQELVITSTIHVTAGGFDYSLRCEGKQTPVHSPILAAITKSPLTSDDVEEVNARSIRGMLERILVDQLEEIGARESNFHFALPQSAIGSLGSLEHASGLMIGSGAADAFKESTNFRVLKEFAASKEAEDFRVAFDQLDVPSRLRRRLGPLVDRSDIPSRLSFRDLWATNRPVLDNYLETYTRMVEAAKSTNDYNTVFWATYPFSFSLWELEQQGKCTAVFLSPLHPLRLGWLASAEQTLSQVEDASLLAGSVEGWNLPLIGPGPTIKSTFIAVPLDAGSGQLFLGWSMLVKVSSESPESLVTPVTVAGVPAPGSASGGMNSSSTIAALNSYKKMHPHISTLSIDLASSLPATRLVEIDDAVLERSREWSRKDSESLPGGVRVWDSTNRAGEPPLEMAQSIFGESPSTPFMWKRYRPGPQSKVRSNIRLLQDSGVKLAVIESQASKSLGLLSETPLRRFEAFTLDSHDNRQSTSNPGLDSSHQDPYSLALIECENFGHVFGYSVVAELHKAALVDERADWTVSGEAMVSPSGIASMLGVQDGGRQMLWEWKPPIFDSNGNDLVQRRPFLAVARVPSSFKSQLDQILEKAKGAATDKSDVDRLLTKLGGRGVGLSALLARGGTHTSGALGFYLALSLLDVVPQGEDDIFVLPIDACEPFIKLLVGSKDHGLPSGKRADLMVLRLSDDSLELTPLEIKLYGLDREKPDPKLPRASDVILQKAIFQASSSWGLLSRLVESQTASIEDGPEKTLVWHNSLVAMVEAASKMRPPETPTSAKMQIRLKKLLSGRLPVSVGRPIVTFFGHEAKTANSLEFETSIVPKSGALSSVGSEVGLFTSNVSAAYSAVNDVKAGKQNLIETWTALFEWSKVGSSSKRAAPEGESGTGLVAGGSIDEPAEKPEPEAPTEKPEPEALTEKPETEAPAEKPDPEAPAATSSDHSLIKGEGVKVQIGTLMNSLNSAPINFWPASTELNQMNIGVVGDLGTGKTQFLKGLIYNLRKDTPKKQPGGSLSFLIFDYKNDYANEDFVEKSGAKVLKPERIPLNIFHLNQAYAPKLAFLRAKAFADVLSKIYAGVGPVQIENLTTAITGCYSIKGGKAPFLSEVLAAYKDLSGKADAVSSILSTFVGLEIFSENEEELVSFSELIEDKVLVLALSELGADSSTQNSLVVLFLDFYYEYMLGSEKAKLVGTIPNQRRELRSFLLVDEATNIMTYELQVLSKLLLQGRDFGFGVILASQYLSHFKTAHVNYGDPLLTWVIHKVPSVKLADLKTLGIPDVSQESADKIAQLGVHQALYSSLDVKGDMKISASIVRGIPFYEWVR